MWHTISASWTLLGEQECDEILLQTWIQCYRNIWKTDLWTHCLVKGPGDSVVLRHLHREESIKLTAESLWFQELMQMSTDSGILCVHIIGWQLEWLGQSWIWDTTAHQILGMRKICSKVVVSQPFQQNHLWLLGVLIHPTWVLVTFSSPQDCNSNSCNWPAEGCSSIAMRTVRIVSNAVWLHKEISLKRTVLNCNVPWIKQVKKKISLVTLFTHLVIMVTGNRLNLKLNFLLYIAVNMHYFMKRQETHNSCPFFYLFLVTTYYFLISNEKAEGIILIGWNLVYNK